MNPRNFPEESMPDMQAGLQTYPDTLNALFAPPSATAGMSFHKPLKDSTGFDDSGIIQTQVQGEDPYPTVFEEQTMAPQGLANATAGELGYGFDPYTVWPPAALLNAVDPGLLAAAESDEEPSMSRVQFLTVTNSSGTTASRIPTVGRPQRKPSRSRSSRTISFGTTDSLITNLPAKNKKTQSNAAAGSSATKSNRSKKTSPGADGDDDANRNTVLERNRVAALKCRKKKKELTRDLKEQCVKLETTNRDLQTEAQGLVDELNSMKNHVMDHAACRDPRIDKWLELEAQRFVRESKERAMREQGGMGGGLTYEKPTKSVASRTATGSSHRNSLSESIMAASGRSRQESAGSPIPPGCQ